MTRSIADVYQGVIIEHDRSPRNFRQLDHASHTAEGNNPLCGDRVSVELDVDAEGRIADIAFQGTGCAISRASASLMTGALKGKTLAEARELFDRFHGLMTGAAVPDSTELGKLMVLQGVAEFPMRVKCATLAWHAMKEAVSRAPAG